MRRAAKDSRLKSEHYISWHGSKYYCRIVDANAQYRSCDASDVMSYVVMGIGEQPNPKVQVFVCYD
jgi:hypothetical protein